MLESRCHQSQGAAQLAVLPERRRHQVVAFIDDQQVPRQVRGPFRGMAGRQELLAHVRLAQIVVGRDDTVERTPRIGVHAEAPARTVGLVAVHHLEAKRELLPQLVAPLPAQRGGGEHQDAADASPEQQLGEDQPRFDGLAEPDVVGDQQADARHPERLEQRHELVVLRAHCAVERTRQRPMGRRAFPIGAEVRREGRPARGP